MAKPGGKGGVSAITVALWIAYAGLTMICLMIGDYLTMIMERPEPIFSVLALVEAILAGVLIYRAGLLSFQTAVLVVTFLLAHRNFDEVIIFTVGMFIYS
jgi:hypothetical protein